MEEYEGNGLRQWTHVEVDEDGRHKVVGKETSVHAGSAPDLSDATLHDYFAAQALASPHLSRIAFNFSEADLDRHFGGVSGAITDAMKMAAAARDVADAMLAARGP